MFLVGGLGPILAAVFLVCRHYGAQDRRHLWRRLWEPRRVGLRWWAIFVAAGVGPTIIEWALTSGGDSTVAVSAGAAASVGMAATWLVFVGGAALAEEPGCGGTTASTPC